MPRLFVLAPPRKTCRASSFSLEERSGTGGRGTARRAVEGPAGTQLRSVLPSSRELDPHATRGDAPQYLPHPAPPGTRPISRTSPLPSGAAEAYGDKK